MKKGTDIVTAEFEDEGLNHILNDILTRLRALENDSAVKEARLSSLETHGSNPNQRRGEIYAPKP